MEVFFEMYVASLPIIYSGNQKFLPIHQHSVFTFVSGVGCLLVKANATPIKN